MLWIDWRQICRTRTQALILYDVLPLIWWVMFEWSPDWSLVLPSLPSVGKAMASNLLSKHGGTSMKAKSKSKPSFWYLLFCFDTSPARHRRTSKISTTWSWAPSLDLVLYGPPSNKVRLLQKFANWKQIPLTSFWSLQAHRTDGEMSFNLVCTVAGVLGDLDHLRNPK